MPRVKATPGFVGVLVVRRRARDVNVLLESEDAATALARRIRTEGPPTDAVTLDSIEVCESSLTPKAGMSDQTERHARLGAMTTCR